MTRLAFALASLGAVGCIADRGLSDLPQMCQETSDCDTASGEICDEGICWGGPPATRLAAVLQPSGEQATAQGLVTTEIPELEIAPDGTISGLEFVDPVVVEGEVTVFCSELADGVTIPCGSDVPIAASIRVERESAIPGGPRFVQTFTSRAGVTTEPSFRMLLPPTTDESRPYTIIITPLAPGDESAGGAPNYAEIAPQIELPPFLVTADTTVEWKVGDPDSHRWVSGCVKSGAGVPPAFQGMTASAVIADPETGGDVRISTVARTDSSGCFSIRVRSDLESFDLVLAPNASKPDPTIRVEAEPLPPGSSAVPCFAGGPINAHCLGDIRGPDLIAPINVTVPIQTTDTGGGGQGVTGASVRFVAELEVPQIGDGRDGRVSATIEVLTASSANSETPGQATAMLRPADYAISVIPGPDSPEVAAVFGLERSIETPGVQVAIQLDRRIAVTGTLVDSTGAPIASAPIAAEPTIDYRLRQSDANRALVQSLGAADITDANGAFILWLDGPLDLGPESDGDPVVYNLVVTPPLLSAAPRWRFENIIASDGESMSLGVLQMPEASFARGPVTGPLGMPAPGVELRVYEPNPTDLCGEVPPAECPASAREVGVWLSDSDSVVRIVLPDP